MELDENKMVKNIILTAASPSLDSVEQLHKRIESLQQQNKVLQMEVETLKLRIKFLEGENNQLRETSVAIQALAEQEEEYISNTLLKKIQMLKKEKESLVQHYEQEEEGLTNDLSKKLRQLQQEKCQLEQDLQQEQECLVNKLLRKTQKLEAEIAMKQSNLEQVRREKVELENTLEKEQEALVNKLWKKMTKLESEKRMLQIQLDQPVSESSLVEEESSGNELNAMGMSSHIKVLKGEICRLRSRLAVLEKEHAEKMQKYVQEEKLIVEENAKLQKRLQIEIQTRENLSQQLSESESSVEMEEDRKYNSKPFNDSNLYRFRPKENVKTLPCKAKSEKECITCGQKIKLSFLKSNVQADSNSTPVTDTETHSVEEEDS